MMGPLQEVDVVGGHEPESKVVSDTDKAGAVSPLLFDAVVRQLDEEVLLAEDVAVGRRRLQGFCGISVGERAVHLSLEAPAQGDEAARVAGEKVPVNTGLVVESVQMSGRGDLDEIAVSLVIGRKERHVVGSILAAVGGLPVEHRSGSDIDLASDNRFHSRLFRGLVELHRPEQNPVVGERDGRHLQLLGP